MKRLLSHIQRINSAQVFWAAVVLAAVLAGWYFFLRPAPAAQQTITLEPQPFLQQVSVSGSVVAAHDVDLGFSQAGRVAAVYAAVGDSVAQGATLAVIENGDLRATLLQKEAALENQQARLAALQAGTRPEALAVAQASVDSDSSALISDIEDAYRTADAAVHNTLDQFINNPRTMPVLAFSTTDTNLKVSIENQRLAAESMLAAWGSDVSSLSPTADLAAAAAESRTNLSAIVSLLSDTNAALNRAIATTQTPQATLDSYTAAVATARTNVNTSLASVTAAAAALDTSRKNLLLQQAGTTQDDIAAQQAQVKAAEADVAAAQAQLNKTVITAPFGGIITKVDAKVGAIVSPNTPLISMISAGAFQIESYVPEVNVALIHVGDSAAITLDAYGDNVPFAAKIVSIDPASTLRDGVSTYRTVLQFASTDSRIKAGMTANIVVTTLQKENVLAVPQALVIYRDGKAYVNVLSGGALQEREVTAGALSSQGDLEILSGLSAGDVVLIK